MASGLSVSLLKEVCGIVGRQVVTRREDRNDSTRFDWVRDASCLEYSTRPIAASVLSHRCGCFLSATCAISASRRCGRAVIYRRCAPRLCLPVLLKNQAGNDAAVDDDWQANEVFGWRLCNIELSWLRAHRPSRSARMMSTPSGASSPGCAHWGSVRGARRRLLQLTSSHVG